MKKGLRKLTAIGDRVHAKQFRRRLGKAQFMTMASEFDVVIMKHCYNASDVLDDIGISDPSSRRQSIENYTAIYRAIRGAMNCYPNTLFIIWTLPPRHRLFDPSEGHRNENAARATLFSEWLQTDFLTEKGPHHNIRIWDFRQLVTDNDTHFLKYQYERNHNHPDSHPNEDANSTVGPLFARFICNAINDFEKGTAISQKTNNIIFLYHSTGRNMYRNGNHGVLRWFNDYNNINRTNFKISGAWYPANGNMPSDYYHAWQLNKVSELFPQSVCPG